MEKGFTLIELLAVISILSILALIIIPLGLSIIDDSEESALLSSSKLYLDGVEYAILNKKLDRVKIKDGTYDILEDGNICLSYDTDNKTCKDILEIEAEGEVPKSGTITIESFEIVSVKFNYDNKIVVKNDSGELVYGVE